MTAYELGQHFVKAAFSLGGEDDSSEPSLVEAIEGGPPVRMRGWAWKSIQNDIDQGERQWMPRLWSSEATPLAKTLAGPGRQALLFGVPSAVAGGFLADAMGGNAGIGAGIGGLAGAVAAYLHRRRQNERTEYAMRRLLPGAIVGDKDRLLNEDRRDVVR